ncbi:MAG: AIPR family protein, partial [Lentisphaeraceae bacterium]|nr:AIPR family protein [Lentisphaeraceae bacterium]
ANSQNKVSAADFFSNHSFHVRIEGFSRRLYAPINPETNKESKWFYERARGQYLDLLAYKTKGETTKAQLEFPKKQLFTKTALSKYENVWCQKPHIVSKGAQYSMQEFANSVDELWAKDDKQFNEYNYKEYVSKAFIFKSTEKIVYSASWYQNAFRAQTVDYTLSFLSSLIEDTFKKFDFNAVWQLQSLPKEIETIIADISSLVYARITAPPAGNANVAQWCKKEFCWTKLKDSKAIIDICVIDKYLIDPSKKIVEQKEAKKVQKIYNEFEAVEIVYTLKPEWQRIEDFGIEQGKLSAKCLGLIRTAKHPMKVPTEKQAVALVKILDRLKDLGLEV